MGEVGVFEPGPPGIFLSIPLFLLLPADVTSQSTPALAHFTQVTTRSQRALFLRQLMQVGPEALPMRRPGVVLVGVDGPLSRTLLRALSIWVLALVLSLVGVATLWKVRVATLVFVLQATKELRVKAWDYLFFLVTRPAATPVLAVAGPQIPVLTGTMVAGPGTASSGAA